MSNYIAIFAVISSIIIGFSAIIIPLWIRGEAERRRYLDKKIEKYNEILHGRIDKCEGSHIHEELCDEKSGNISKRVDSLSGGH